MQHLIFGVYVVLAASALARLEIEIEGPCGWAANLPTWRISNRWTRLFYGSRPLTGYHLWLQIFVLVLAQLPFGMGFVRWSVGGELKSIGFLILFFITEDFLWFIFNPAFGLAKFRRQHIWWHEPTWWWVAPRDYWIFLVIGIASYWGGVQLH